MSQKLCSQLNLDRVAVIGCPGSGKSTLSVQMGQILDRQVYHLDKLLLLPNWQAKDYDNRLQIHQDITNQQKWIVDGMWASHVAERFTRATTVVFLDMPICVCTWRLRKRRAMYRGQQRPDVADGCIEGVDKEFLSYVKNFNKQQRPKILQLIRDNPQVQVVRLRNDKQVKKFILSLKNSNRNNV